MLTALLLLWLLLAVGCALAGLALTCRKSALPSPVKRLPHRITYARARTYASGGEPMILRAHAPRPQGTCTRCAHTLDAEACFCGFCGLYLEGK